MGYYNYQSKCYSIRFHHPHNKHLLMIHILRTIYRLCLLHCLELLCLLMMCNHKMLQNLYLLRYSRLLRLLMISIQKTQTRLSSLRYLIFLCLLMMSNYKTQNYIYLLRYLGLLCLLIIFYKQMQN